MVRAWAGAEDEHWLIISSKGVKVHISTNKSAPSSELRIMINYEELTWENELLLVFEITGGCGRRQTESWSLT